MDILQKYPGRLAVGVSGGADSMCLLSLILSCGIFDKKDITVLHVDHGLRPTSERDRRLVQDYCALHGVGIKVFSPDVAGEAHRNKRSIETEARLIRHGFFKAFCAESGARLALAHTADDQAETILMHIFRGCGLQGLVGMTECDGYIIRPLIHTAKAEIYDYVKAGNIPFFEDETNADNVYSRNFVRKLLNAAQMKYPGARNNLNLLSLIAGGAQGIIKGLLKPEYFGYDRDTVLLDKAALCPPLDAYYVMEAAKRAGLVCDLEFKHVAAVSAMRDKKAGSVLELPHGLRIYSERGRVAFCFEKTLFKGEIEFKAGENKLGDVVLLIKPVNIAEVRAFLDGEGKTAIENDKSGSRKLFADLDLLQETCVRLRRDGDRFLPYGGQNKKLKEYLNGKRIENRVKDKLPLVCRGADVLVIGGVEISHDVRVSEKTRRAVLITVSEKA